MINYNAALPAENYPASKSSINVTDWIQGIKGNLSYLIRQAFRGGEVGFAYDPNDLTTLYQDAAGTVPVTAAGQPVGLVLDKGKGLTTGANLVSKPNTALLWLKQGNNTVSQFDSETILLTYIDNVTLGNLNLTAATLLNANISNTGWYEISLDVKVSNGFSWVQIIGISNNSAYKVTSTEYVRLTWRCLTNVGTPNIHVFSSVGNEPTSTLIKNISVKALAGNHAYQTVSASRPILRQSPILGNELIANGDFSNSTTGWTTSQCSMSVNNGEITLTANGVSFPYIYQVITGLSIGSKYQLTAEAIKGNGASLVGVQINGIAGNYTAQTTKSFRVYEFTATSTTHSVAVAINGATVAGDTATFDNVSLRKIEGYYADRNYLEFDGVDDFLQTNAIDFTTTDKVSVFTGVRKLSDTARGVLFELGSAVGLTPGSFGIEAPRLNTANAYGFTHQGSENPGVVAVSGSNYPAPNSAVLVGKGNLSTTLSESIKVNSITTVGPNTTLGANTKYGNYPLYIGRRAGTSLPFNGHLYSLIGIGRLTTDAETIALEKSIAKNTGVTLSV